MRVSVVRPSSVAQASERPGWDLARLSGSLVALATPFRDGRLDLDAMAALCERQVSRGAAGLVACGSTGEAATLSPAEQDQVVGAAVAAARGRVPVIAGCTHSSTAVSTELAAAAAGRGAAALLCAAPPYSRPTQDGIAAHIRAVAHASDLPIMLYDVPSRAAVGIADATVARLFERGLIFALKDATADLARPARLRRLCGAGLRQFTGDDATAVAYRAMGGHGCVSVTANLAPALCTALHAAWERGDLATVADLRDRLAPLHDALFLESNPIPLKAALGILRLCEGELRLPLTRASAATRDRLAATLADLVPAEEDACAPRLSLVR